MRSDSAVSIVIALGSSAPAPIELDIVVIVFASSSSDLLQACAIASNQSPDVDELSADGELVVNGAVAIMDSGLMGVVLMACSLRWWWKGIRNRAGSGARRASARRGAPRWPRHGGRWAAARR